MAMDFDIITKANRNQMGSAVIRLANMMREACDLCDALNDAAGHMWTGSTYTTLIAQFSLDASVDPANFLTLLGNLNEILNTNTDVTGANRAARIQEFIARIAGQ